MFQYSTLTSLDKTATAAWTTEAAAEYWSMSDSLGNRSRIAQICISNAFNSKERRYQVMQQVRILGSYGVVIFLGRIMNIEPSLDENKLILTCRDYLGDLTERLVTASKSDGSYTASSRKWLIKEILDNEIEDPAAGGDIDRSLTSRLLQDPSNYLERITKTYAQRGAYGSVTDGVAGNYQYRGTKSVLEAISEIASEDAQQDLMVLSYANTKVLSDINSTNHTSDPKTHPSTYWVDYTAGLQDGNDWFPSMRHVRNVATPDAIDSASGTGQDILYIGSNSKFDGLEYTFRQTGVTIHESNYTTLAWQYWSGEEWRTFTPDKDSLFKQDPSVTDRLSGSTSWPSLIADTTNTHDNLGQISYAASGQGMDDWEKRDLAENYDMPHYNDWNNNSNSAWRDWRAPWHTKTYNTFVIPNGDNELYMYKNSFTVEKICYDTWNLDRIGRNYKGCYYPTVDGSRYGKDSSKGYGTPTLIFTLRNDKGENVGYTNTTYHKYKLTESFYAFNPMTEFSFSKDRINQYIDNNKLGNDGMVYGKAFVALFPALPKVPQLHPSYYETHSVESAQKYFTEYNEAKYLSQQDGRLASNTVNFQIQVRMPTPTITVKKKRMKVIM